MTMSHLLLSLHFEEAECLGDELMIKIFVEQLYTLMKSIVSSAMEHGIPLAVKLSLNGFENNF